MSAGGGSGCDQEGRQATMKFYQEAQETFRKNRTNETELNYHHVVCKAYLSNEINTDEMHQAMDEIEGFCVKEVRSNDPHRP